MSLFVTKELGERLEDAEVITLFSRLSAIKEIDGNPMQVDIQRFGNATAFSAKNIPGPAFNTVKGLKEGDQPYIDQIIQFYNNKNIPVRFELTPAHTSSELLTYLNKKGFYQIDFHSSLYMPLKLELDKQLMIHDIPIREIKKEEFSIFSEIYTKGFGMPSFLQGAVAQNNAVLFDHPGWTFYLAFLQGTPIGLGVLHINNHIATLSAATTIPSFRNNGVQSALIKQRMYKALVKNCELITGQAKYGSVSQNNMERAGMKLAYTKAIWVNKSETF